MAHTEGNFYGSTNEYHSFVTNDPVLVHLGLGTFTKKGIKQALEQIRDDKVADLGDEEFFKNYIFNKDDLSIDTLFLNANNNTWSAQSFNSSSNQYSAIVKTFTQISALIDDFEDKIKDLIKQHADKTEASTAVKNAKQWLNANINNIKNGTERCYVLSGSIFYIPFNGEQLDIKTKLFFNIPGDGRKHTERVVANRGKQVLSALPQTATGLKYSHTKSKIASASGTAGQFIKPNDASGDDASDYASGDIRLSFNEALGMWESSQTILARLITDVAPANNQAFAIPKEDNDGFLNNSADAALFYQKGSKYYTGLFTTGLAVPMNSQAGNPHLFGPNIIIDYHEKRIEKIRVVNRSDKSFTQGTLVLCTLIGSEWIIQEFGLPGAGLPTQMGTWTFSKLIANSDAFFRDKDGSSLRWSANTYEIRARSAWYKEWKAAVAAGTETLLPFHDVASLYSLNTSFIEADISFNPSLGYYVASSFDSAQYFDLTSIDTVFSDKQQDYAMGTDVPLFWGAVFPDGYQQSAGNSNVDFTPQGINHELYFPQPPYTGPRSNTPADIAVNGLYSDDNFSSPILPLDYWQQLLNSMNIYQAAKLYRQEIFNNQTVYQRVGMTPNNANKLQFSPLCAEMIIHADTNAATPSDDAYDDRADIYAKIRADYPPANGDTNLFGKMLQRFTTSPKDKVAYDKYIKHIPLSKPLGTLRIFGSEPDDYSGLNTVGIVAAINRFSRPGGGTLNIEINQDFGPPQFTSVTSGQAASFNSVAAFFGIVAITPGTGPQTYGFPQYGAQVDNYNVFGTTALHARIFDAWPRIDTIWDTRFFAALHFHPLYPEEDEDHASVDFQVPTMNTGSFPDINSSVTKDTPIAPREDWSWDTIRRGKLLTSGGFAYHKLTIGLDPNTMKIIKAGTSIESDTFTITSNNVKFDIVATNGGITSINFLNDDNGEVLSGEDFTKESFTDHYVDVENAIDEYGYILSIGDAILSFQGVVRSVVKVDRGPTEHSGGIKRLTTGTSGGEAGRITGLLSTEFALNPNSTNEYDAYFFFHNDISHTLMYSYPGTQYPGFAQYLIMNIN